MQSWDNYKTGRWSYGTHEVPRTLTEIHQANKVNLKMYLKTWSVEFSADDNCKTLRQLALSNKRESNKKKERLNDWKALGWWG